MGLGRRAPGFCVRDDPHLGMDRKGVEQDEMSQPLVYIDTSDVREGALEELKSAIGDLTDFVESHEPQIDFHMDVAGPRFARFADLVTLSSIRIFGELSPKAVKQLENKVQLLGSGEVTVHPLHAGFGRFEAH
jgi:hypothetical protein